MKLIGSLEAHYSRRDINGNCYWAMRYTDHETGTVIEATVTGGESNVNAIRCDWDGPRTGWAGGIRFSVHEHGIRDFNRMTKHWPHAGCDPDQLRQFIKDRLAGTH